MEYNKFAFMQLDDGSVLGADFQNGTLKGYARVEDYVFDMQGGCCALCGKPMDKNNYHCHHIDTSTIFCLLRAGLWSTTSSLLCN